MLPGLVETCAVEYQRITRRTPVHKAHLGPFCSFLIIVDQYSSCVVPFLSPCFHREKHSVSSAVNCSLEELQLALSDSQLWGELLESQRSRLRGMVDARMHQQLRGRIDASDVIQEAFIDATQRLPEYVENPVVPFYVWLRSLTSQRLAIAHRHGLGTKARDARREEPMVNKPQPDATSVVLLAALIGQVDSPSSIAVQQEQKKNLEAALGELEPIDYEILVLRHFEEMTNSEVAATLDIKPSAAANRYLRALERLKSALARVAPGPSEF